MDNILIPRNDEYPRSTIYKPIGNWDTRQVRDMSHMFYHAIAFDQSLYLNWETRNVETMERMFYTATAFNQPLNQWDVSIVKDMSWMFAEANSFNQPLHRWDTGQVSAVLQ